MAWQAPASTSKHQQAHVNPSQCSGWEMLRVWLQAVLTESRLVQPSGIRFSDTSESLHSKFGESTWELCHYSNLHFLCWDCPKSSMRSSCDFRSLCRLGGDWWSEMSWLPLQRIFSVGELPWWLIHMLRLQIAGDWTIFSHFRFCRGTLARCSFFAFCGRLALKFRRERHTFTVFVLWKALSVHVNSKALKLSLHLVTILRAFFACLCPGWERRALQFSIESAKHGALDWCCTDAAQLHNRSLWRCCFRGAGKVPLVDLGRSW